MVSVSYWKTFLNVNILIVAGKLSIVGMFIGKVVKQLATRFNVVSESADLVSNQRPGERAARAPNGPFHISATRLGSNSQRLSTCIYFNTVSSPSLDANTEAPSQWQCFPAHMCRIPLVGERIVRPEGAAAAVAALHFDLSIKGKVYL